MSFPKFSFIFYICGIFLYDFIDGTTKIAISAISIFFMILSLIIVKFYVKRDIRNALIGLTLILYAWLVAIALYEPVNGTIAPSLVTGMRHLSVFVMLLFMLCFHRNFSSRFTFIVSMAIMMQILFYGILYDPVYLNGQSRMYPILDGLHTSGYIISSLIIILFLLMVNGSIGLKWSILLISICVILMYENGVRTPALSVMAFFATYYGLNVINKTKYRIVYASIIYISVILSLGVILNLSVEVIDLTSSGRISNYIYRLDLIEQRSVSGLIFGSGPGTDLVTTTVWWWDAKDSHSDILKYFWESGIIGTTGFFLFFVTMMRYQNGVLIPLIAMILVSSTVSNGFMSRPNASIFIILAGMIMLNRENAAARTPERSKEHP